MVKFYIDISFISGIEFEIWSAIFRSFTLYKGSHFSYQEVWLKTEVGHVELFIDGVNSQVVIRKQIYISY